MMILLTGLSINAKEVKAATHYKIILKGNGGTYSGGKTQIELKDIPANITIRLSKTYVPNDRSYFDFLGWAENSTATTPKYKIDSTIKVTKNMTLYAVWKRTHFDLTLQGNGGIYSNNQSSLVLNRIPISVIVRFRDAWAPKDRANYIFLGWDKNKSAVEPQYKIGNQINEKNTTTLYAIWVKEFYAMKFDANGGTGSQNYSVKYNTSGKTTPKLPTREGYSFLGWATSATATTPTYKTTVSYSQIKKDVTYYAVWRKTRISFPLDTYSFENRGRKIKLETFQRMFGDVKGKRLYESETLYKKNSDGSYQLDKDGNRIVDKYPGERGLCHGFTVTVASASLDETDGFTVGNLGATHLCDLLETSTFSFGTMNSISISDYIGFGFLHQLTPVADNNDYYCHNKGYTQRNFKKLVTSVKDYSEGTGTPVEMGIRGYRLVDLENAKKSGKQTGLFGGHSVLPLDVYEDNDNKTILLIYDNDYPTELQYLTLTKIDGEYVYWDYTGLGGLTSNTTGYEGCTGGTPNISFNTEEIKHWKDDFTMYAENSNYLEPDYSTTDTTANYLVETETDEDFKVDNSNYSEINASEMNDDKSLFWVDDSTVNLKKIDNVTVSDDKGTMTVKSPDNANVEIDLLSEAANKISVPANKNVTVTYKEGKNTISIKVTGKETVEIGIKDKNVLVHNAENAIVNVTINGEKMKVSNYEGGDYSICLSENKQMKVTSLN